MTRAYFITGTDTDIGKTYVACALLHAFRQAGHSAIGMKPVAAGINAAGKNDDVEMLIAASSVAAACEVVNPYCFPDPIAPHIAAQEADVEMRPEPIQAALKLLAQEAEVVVVEGVGGFLVPLGDSFDSADLAVALAAPIILVVGMRLGCLSHALLTQEAIGRRRLKLAGWVANCIDPAMPRFEENLATLKTRIAAPLLGIVPHAPTGGPEEAAKHLTLPL